MFNKIIGAGFIMKINGSLVAQMSETELLPQWLYSTFNKNMAHFNKIAYNSRTLF